MSNNLLVLSLLRLLDVLLTVIMLFCHIKLASDLFIHNLTYLNLSTGCESGPNYSQITTFRPPNVYDVVILYGLIMIFIRIFYFSKRFLVQDFFCKSNRSWQDRLFDSFLKVISRSHLYLKRILMSLIKAARSNSRFVYKMIGQKQ